ncbi:MAG: hypothetical protein JWM37_686 [Candidatus Saccharibacteria bacterium]|nr:hypothetical protein [Candidatus Saccharibacteria bacterium]
MSLYAEGTFTGAYTPSDPAEIAAANNVIGHEFAAAPDGLGALNIALAENLAENFADKQLYIAHSISKALKIVAPEISPSGIFLPVSSDTTASEGGTWSELIQYKEMTGESDLSPILFAQAYHIGRVSLQAKKAKLNPLLPPDMPKQFDTDSIQWWCRGPLRWGIRELPGALVLRHRGHL